jgi:hypothetical protein
MRIFRSQKTLKSCHTYVLLIMYYVWRIICSSEIKLLNMAIEWIKQMLCMREVQLTNLGLYQTEWGFRALEMALDHILVSYHTEE